MEIRKMIYTVVVFLLVCVTLIGGDVKNSRILTALVPRIDQPGFQLTPNGQQYNLIISLPDGSNRVENVELREQGTPEEHLHVTGTLNEIFPVGTAVTIYEAGRHGYIVKYKYVGVEPTFKPFFISPAGLKSSVG